MKLRLGKGNMAHTINATALGRRFAVQVEGLVLHGNGAVGRHGQATILDATRKPIGSARFGSTVSPTRGFWIHEVRIADQRAPIDFYAEADELDARLRRALNDTHALAL